MVEFGCEAHVCEGGVCDEFNPCVYGFICTRDSSETVNKCLVDTSIGKRR